MRNKRCQASLCLRGWADSWPVYPQPLWVFINSNNIISNIQQLAGEPELTAPFLLIYFFFFIYFYCVQQNCTTGISSRARAWEGDYLEEADQEGRNVRQCCGGSKENVLGIDGLHLEGVCLLFRSNGQATPLRVLCPFLNKILAGDFSKGPRSINRLGVWCIENVRGNGWLISRADRVGVY